MKRLRISPLQVSILRVIRADEKEHGGCCPTSPHAKHTLFGRDKCLSTSERVTLHRSIARLLANGMITRHGFGWYRLAEKGAAWLDAADGAIHTREG